MAKGHGNTMQLHNNNDNDDNDFDDNVLSVNEGNDKKSEKASAPLQEEDAE